ncbi:MAG: transcription antitermination factor NusB [Clostridiales bacterium 43-6]|nr:MAG: transcription antitermination factor NusB [Clostridiales bacterium 43-6]
MNRKKQRNQILLLSYEKTFHDDPVPEIINLACEARDMETDEFINSSVNGIFDHLSVIDEKINENLIGWKINRVSRVSLSILRIAVYEMLFCEDIPVSVSINEAVELAKEYCGDEDPSYINGVLGSISKSINQNG